MHCCFRCRFAHSPCSEENEDLGGGLNHFYFHPYLGKWSNLTKIFQTGWNHQLGIEIDRMVVSSSPNECGFPWLSSSSLCVHTGLPSMRTVTLVTRAYFCIPDVSFVEHIVDIVGRGPTFGRIKRWLQFVDSALICMGILPNLYHDRGSQTCADRSGKRGVGFRGAGVVGEEIGEIGVDKGPRCKLRGVFVACFF